MSSQSKSVDVQFVNDIAIMTMHTEDSLQEFTIEFIFEVEEALDAVLSNPNCHALVTTGTGRHYSNGLNLRVLSQKSREHLMAFSTAYCNLMWKIFAFPMPTVAALNGHAFAGGCIMALAHDVIVMNEGRGWICLSEIHLNLPINPLLMAIVRNRVPIGRAQRDVVLLGRRLASTDALKLGIVDRAVPLASLLDIAQVEARDTFKLGPIDRDAYRKMKQGLFQGARQQSSYSVDDGELGLFPSVPKLQAKV